MNGTSDIRLIEGYGFSSDSHTGRRWICISSTCIFSILFTRLLSAPARLDYGATAWSATSRVRDANTTREAAATLPACILGPTTLRCTSTASLCIRRKAVCSARRLAGCGHDAPWARPSVSFNRPPRCLRNLCRQLRLALAARQII